MIHNNIMMACVINLSMPAILYEKEIITLNVLAMFKICRLQFKGLYGGSKPHSFRVAENECIVLLYIFAKVLRCFI